MDIKSFLLNKFRRKKTYRGFVDNVYAGYISGWCFNRFNPDEKVELVVLVDGKQVAKGVATLFREDLLQNGIENPYCGFNIKLPDLSNYVNSEFKVIPKKSNIPLKCSSTLKHSFSFTDKYYLWIKKYEKSFIDSIQKKGITFKYRPLISIVMPVYNSPSDLLIKAIESVRSQIYTNWELCIADDASTFPHIKHILDEYARKYENIKIIFREKRGHICEASNSALTLANGEYIGFLDHDDELAPHALYMVVKAINEIPNAKIIYSDEDKINENNIRSEPHFKPDWSPDFLLSGNYIAHLLVVKKEIIDKIEGFKIGTEGSQDYDLVLKASLHCKDEEIIHIPHILYHWRMWEKSTANSSQAKDYTESSGIKALKGFFTIQGIENISIKRGKYPNTYKVLYPIPIPHPMVSIIIPTKDGVDLLSNCIKSIINKTEYEPFEIIIINHDSQSEMTYNFFREIALKYDNIKILRHSGAFNYSLMNNKAVRHAKGELLLFLNNDTEVINPEWLSNMVSHAVRPQIGCVGAKLYYPDDTIQHAGVILGLGGVAGHHYKGISKDNPGYFGRLNLTQNLSAVTGACLMVRKNIFEEVGGFNHEDLKVAFNDIDFCLRVRQKGYRNLWTPYAELYHLESKSRGDDNTHEKIERFKKEIEYMKNKWGDLLFNDPYYNQNFSLDGEGFIIKD